ncbi:MAG TPA: DUF1571 domain-containing protein [Planctomycetota bacterium]|nr:DUF1571 domain-containing protein [Planctomycetota bacterium]
MRRDRATSTLALTALVCVVLASGVSAPSTLPGAGDDAPKDLPRDPMKLVEQCVEAAKDLGDHTACLEMQERLFGKLRPVQAIEGRFRRTPRSVYLKWVAGPHAGREALWVDGKNDGMLLVYLGDWPEFRRVVRLRLDSAETKQAARHAITCAGVHYLVERMHEQYVEAQRAGTLVSRVEGPETLDGRPTLRLVRDLPDGGRCVWNVDTEIRLPVRVETRDKTGKLVECYWYRKLKVDVKLDDAAFAPEEIW